MGARLGFKMIIQLLMCIFKLFEPSLVQILKFKNLNVNSNKLTMELFSIRR